MGKARLAGVASVLVLLGGCAITSSHHTGPNGRPVHWIDGMSASAAYSKAAKLCPHGYNILGDPEQTSVLDYMMTVECKDPQPAAQFQPTPAAYVAPAVQSAAGRSKEQQLEELSREPGISYDEYQRRYRVIMAQ